MQDIYPPGYNRNKIKLCNKLDFNLKQHGASNYHQPRSFSMKTLYIMVFFLISLSLTPFTSKFVSNVYAQSIGILTKGDYQLKIFIQNSDTIEIVVNDWLASQENIIVDQIKANNSTGNFSVIIRYHSGGQGKVSTRIKFFDTNTAVNVPKSSSQTPEAWTQNSISAFSSEHNIHFVDVLTGNGPWDMFVVYDDEQGLVSEKPFSNELIEDVLDHKATTTLSESITSHLDKDQITNALMDGILVSATTTQVVEITSSSQMAAVSEAGTEAVDTVIETLFNIISADDDAKVVPTSEASASSPIQGNIEMPSTLEDTNTNDTITTTF